MKPKITLNEDVIKRYTFNYFTGFGIGEIWGHTINIYPICVKDISFEEAVIKAMKKAASASKYNDCFYKNKTIQVIEEYNKQSRVGVYWIEDKVIKWEGEIVYYTPSCFGNVCMQCFPLPNVESHYGNWIADYCCGKITYSYVGWIKYSMDKFDYIKWWSTGGKEKQIKDYKKYVVDEIQYLLHSEHCPEEDKIILKTIKLLNDEQS